MASAPLVLRDDENGITRLAIIQTDAQRITEEVVANERGSPSQYSTLGPAVQDNRHALPVELGETDRIGRPLPRNGPDNVMLFIADHDFRLILLIFSRQN